MSILENHDGSRRLAVVLGRHIHPPIAFGAGEDFGIIPSILRHLPLRHAIMMFGIRPEFVIVEIWLRRWRRRNSRTERKQQETEYCEDLPHHLMLHKNCAAHRYHW